MLCESHLEEGLKELARIFAREIVAELKALKLLEIGPAGEHPQRVEGTSGGRLIRVSKWKNYHDFPPEGGLRHLIVNAEINGFKKCVKRVGRCVLIDEDAFFEWVRSGEGAKRPDYGKAARRR